MNTPTVRRAVKLGAWILAAVLLAGCGGTKAPDNPASTPASPPAEQPSEPQPTQPVIGQKAPEIKVTDIATGESITLEKLKGQVVALNFWATWCPPCKAEMPDLQTLSDEMKGKVRVVAVGVNTETPTGMAEFAKQRGLTFTIGYDGGRAQRSYQVYTIPSTFWIDQNGILRAVSRSAMPLEYMEQTAIQTAAQGRGNP